MNSLSESFLKCVPLCPILPSKHQTRKTTVDKLVPRNPGDTIEKIVDILGKSLLKCVPLCPISSSKH